MKTKATEGIEIKARATEGAEITDQAECRMAQLTRRSLLGLAVALPVSLTASSAATQQVRRPSVVNGRRYLQYDVFTDKPLAGNQLAVFTDTAGLPTEQMQAMTRETKFSECTFVQ